MDFPRVDILSKATFNIKPTVAGGDYDGYWGADGEFIYSTRGATLSFVEQVKDYSWIEVTFQALVTPPAVTGIGFQTYLTVRTLESDADYSFAVSPLLATGFNGEVVVKIPFVGTIEEIEVGTTYAGSTAAIKKIVVVKRSDNFTRTNAVATARGSAVGGGFVYNAALGCYEAQILANASALPAISFTGLVNGLEYGIARWEHLTAIGFQQTTRASFIWDGVPASIFGTKGELSFSGDPTLNVFPQVITFANLAGPQTAYVRLYLEIGSFVDQNITAFGANAQPNGVPQPVYNPLALPSTVNGWLFAAAGVISGFAAIPVTAIDFTAGVVGPANFNTVTAQVLNVTTSAAIKDLALTRTTQAAGFGSLWYTDNAGILTPTDITKYALRTDLKQIGLGGGIADGIAVNVDLSATTNTGLTERAGVKVLGRTAGAIAEAGIASYRSDIAPANAVYTLPYIHHFVATQLTPNGASTTTVVRGFYANSSIAKGLTNYGFSCDISAATNTYQLAMAGSAASFFGGPVGILNTDPIGGGILLRIQGTNPATVTSLGGVYCNWTSPATATVQAIGYESDIATPASAFTLTTLTHYLAATTTKGAGSTITTVRGFYAANGIATGTNNYGFFSDIANATTTFQVALTGTAPSYTNSQFGFGGQPATSDVVTVNTNASIVTGTAQYGIRVGNSFNVGATASAAAYGSDVQTQNSVVTYNAVMHYWARSSTKGAASTITSLYGFIASNAIAVGTTNIGFFSDITAATGNYQLRMQGTGKSRFDGPIGLSTDPAANVLIQANVAGVSGAGSVGYYCAGVFPSTVVTTALGFQAQLQTAAAAVTYTELTGFRVDTWVKGATSAITVASGFRVEDNFAVGTSSYGFMGNVADAGPGLTNKFNFYGVGTARSYFSKIGAGSLALSNWTNDDRITSFFGLINSTGITSVFGNVTYLVCGNNTTVSSTAVYGALETSAAAFTLTDARIFYAASILKGAGSTITNVYGFYVAAGVGGSGTNTYGFRSDLASASNTYQLYMSGTALNSIKGGLILDTTAAPTVAAGQVGFGATTGTTVGAAGAASALPATPTGYLIINVAGTTQRIPYYN